MKKRDRVILAKIIEESSAISRMLTNIDEIAFLANDEKMRAVCMTLINIGELVKNLNDDFRLNHNKIPWKEIAGLRDVAAHGYFALRMPDIWVYASAEIPVFKTEIEEILANEEETH